LENVCNDNCRCTTRIFTPICAPDNITSYFSPCFANCKRDPFKVDFEYDNVNNENAKNSSIKKKF
jgi:hypothetical protein